VKLRRLLVDRIQVPLVKPYRLSRVYGTLCNADALIVRLETDTGLVGIGEADPQPPFTEETTGGVVAALRDFAWPAIRGEACGEIAAIMDRLDETLPGNTMAKGAIDMALHDLLGKALGVPVSRIMGGARRATLPVLWPLGDGTAEEDIPIMEPRREQGFGTFMLKMGAGSVAADIKRVRALSEYYGEGVKLIPDANQGWTRSDAMRFARATADVPLVMIEQPTHRSDPEALGLVRRVAGAPISADESVQSFGDAKQLVAAEAVDVFSIKVSKNGGLTGSRRIAELARSHGIRCYMNSMIEFGVSQAASLQLAVTLPNLVDAGHAYMSTLRLEDDVTNFSEFVGAGEVNLPDAPGLGVSLSEEKLERYGVGHERFD